MTSAEAVSPRDGLTDDGFLGGALRILQPAKGYRAGIDAVLLAASVPAAGGARVLEAGMGVGVASLCLAHRAKGAHVTGVELQPELADLARENARRNGLEARIRVIEGDIAAPGAAGAAPGGLEPGTFDHVLANPPFYDPASAALAPNESKALSHAHSHGRGDLADWVRFCCLMARPGEGTVTLVHRADALPDLLRHAEKHLGGLVAFPLWPAAGRGASRVILQGRRGSRAPFRLASGLVLHGAGGGFTEAAEAVLRHGAALPLD